MAEVQNPFTPRKKRAILDVIQNTFLSKSTLNFVGFVLKAAIVCTITNKPIKKEPATGAHDDGGRRLLAAVMTYLILVIVVVVARESISRRTQSLTMPKDRADTLKALLAGLNLIPAWGFKDFVAVVIAGTAWYFAFFVLIGATVAAVLIEPPKPAAGEVPTYFECFRKTLSGCMALGVGFAMHTIPVTIWRSFGYDFFTIPVTGTYAVLVTSLVIWLQVNIKKIKTEPDQLYYRSFLNFSSSSGNFMSAWAWDSLLEAMRREIIAPHDESCVLLFWINMAWAFFVLIVAALSVVGIQYYIDEDNYMTEMEEGLQALSKTIAACCVAWGFMDVFQGVYKCLEYGNYYVLCAWIMAVCVCLLAVGIMHGGNYLIERAKKEQ